MYDVLMDLPLLQGISRDQVSTLLEKTHLEFINAKPGELLRNFDSDEDSLLYVISGEVEIEWRNKEGLISIKFRQGAKSVLGASHLFGLLRNNPYAVRAISQTSLMRIEKSQYLKLLQTQPIYLINLLNYLSLRAQKPLELLATMKDGSPEQLLGMWVKAATPSSAYKIIVHISNATFCKFTNMSEEQLRRRLFAMQKNGIIELGEDTIAIPSRDKLLGDSLF